MEGLLGNIITEVTPILNTLIFTVLGLVGTWLGIQAKTLMKRMERSQKLKEVKEALEINKEIVGTAVDYAEQFGKHLAGTEKFRLAKDKAYQIMNEWGIQISDSEIDALIEQFVHGYNKGDKKKVDIEAEQLKIEENVKK